MMMFRDRIPDNRGMTLVELMIVVAVVGILAGIGGMAYMKHIKSAKIGKLKQYAMEISNAQEQYKAQNSSYLDLSSHSPYSEGNVRWEQLLGFSKKGLSEQGIEITTEAGSSDDDCGICGDSPPDFSTIWFAIEVTQDLNPEEDSDTTVTYWSGLPEPMVSNEGD